MQIRHDIIKVTNADKYCREPYKIKISKDAIKAFINNESLVCHHINGLTYLTGFNKEDLIKMNMYFNRPASELKILSNAEHTTLHFKGQKRTEEFCKKQSTSRKGVKHPLYGKHHGAETKAKMSKALKGNKNAVGGKSFTGKHWYNNGIINAAAETCPEGFVPGMLMRKKHG